MKNRRQYDKEFKQMAVELSRSHDNFRELAKELDIRPELLFRWRREAGKHPDTCFPGQGKVAHTEYEKELARLKKELRDAQLERDILKRQSASSPRAMESILVYKPVQLRVSHWDDVPGTWRLQECIL